MRDILRASLEPLNQHLRFIFLDILWRFIWLICSTIGVGILWFVVVGQLGAMEWEGPELGGSNPIMLLAALRQFWDAYGSTILAELGLLLAGGLVLWMVLEALFRGGFKGFWVYLGTSVGRLSLLGGAVAVFTILGSGDETNGTLLVGVILVAGLWFIVSLFETAIRRDALALIAVDLPKVLKVFGTLLFAEVFVAFALWGSVIAAVIRVSGPALLAIVVVIAAVVVPFWMVLQSYLVAVRFSAIDIMRRNLE